MSDQISSVLNFKETHRFTGLDGFHNEISMENGIYSRTFICLKLLDGTLVVFDKNVTKVVLNWFSSSVMNVTLQFS